MSLSVLILGTDAVAAASPRTAIQLMHACRKLGFEAVVPVSWGDELVAKAVINECATRTVPRIQCSCPMVRDKLGAGWGLIQESMIEADAPPLAVAKYLRRALNGAPLHATYVGNCPIGVRPEIDQQLRPDELLSAIERAGIDLGAEPTVFEDVIPPDLRRFHSQAGGVPDYEQLWEQARFLISVPDTTNFAVNVAQALLDGGTVLVDLSIAAACPCRMAYAAPGERHSSVRAPGPILP